MSFFSRVYTVWESLEKHQAFMNDKAIYNPMLAAVASMFDLATLTMWHIRTTSEPFAALEAPITELTTFTLREGHSPAVLEALVQKIAHGLNEASKPNAAGIVDATCGTILEDEKVVVLIVGWTTFEVCWHLLLRVWSLKRLILRNFEQAHRTAIGAKDLKVLVGMFDEARTIADIHTVHTSLALYRRSEQPFFPCIFVSPWCGPLTLVQVDQVAAELRQPE